MDTGARMRAYCIDIEEGKTMNVNTRTLGHHNTSGGLRGHSIGALYPCGVQGRIIYGRTWWQAWNLETGECWPIGYRDHTHAEAIARGMLDHYRTGFNSRVTSLGAGIEGVTELTLSGYQNVDARRYGGDQ